MSVYKRALSQREADRCENAREPVCTCRCGGIAHGRARITRYRDLELNKEELAEERKAYEALPKNDPHHLPTKEEAWAIARDRQTHRRYHNQPWRGQLYATWPAAMRDCVICVDEGRPTREEWNAEHPTPVDA